LNADAYGQRAEAAFEQHDYAQAVADRSRQIELAPTEAWIYGERMEAYVLLGDDNAALGDAQHIIELTPDDRLGYHAEGWVRFMKGEYDAALKQMNRAFDLSAPADRPEILAVRGRIQVRRNDLAAAAADLTAALHDAPANSSALLGQAELDIARNDLEAARLALRSWAANGDGGQRYGWGYVLRARIEAAAQQPAAARASLAQARQLALFPGERAAADALAAQLDLTPTP
jgi:tetratricopeptide (TPR) repeat protein